MNVLNPKPSCTVKTELVELPSPQNSLTTKSDQEEFTSSQSSLAITGDQEDLKSPNKSLVAKIGLDEIHSAPNHPSTTTYYEEALPLLQKLIATPSFSREEDSTAEILQQFLQGKGIPSLRSHHNIIAYNAYFDPAKPTILLNSHHDTVKPNTAYTRDPFQPSIEDGKLYGLGSNDAGGSLVALLMTFCHFYHQEELAYNLIFAATAEEEVSGAKGMAHLRDVLPPLDFALVGEPTGMQLAIAEKGLLVIDGTAHGEAGHAAHHQGKNALYTALEDIAWIKSHQFPQASPTLGPVRMTVSQISAGQQHNLVAPICEFVIDVRVNECYSNQEVFAVLDAHTESTLKARSFRLNSSSIPLEHPVVQSGIALGRQTYGSPTLSDQALLACPSLKMGPGDSHRSHTADEFIYLHEIEEGIALYIDLLAPLLNVGK